MKYNVKIGEKTYTVEIEDIHARPVVAHVDGERVEVMPESGTMPQARKEAGARSSVIETKPFNPNFSTAAAPSPNPALSGNTIAAPLPGTVVEIFVKPGDKVEAGQTVLVIEAMKMKNSIRSTWSGKIGEVCVSVGQTVAHKQALVKFAALGEASWM
ncbi:MAG: acetyl-CoA carboxylase biotin carboxyl carrier protein subunit [Chloroflexota bacterium]